MVIVSKDDGETVSKYICFTYRGIVITVGDLRTFRIFGKLTLCQSPTQSLYGFKCPTLVPLSSTLSHRYCVCGYQKGNFSLLRVVLDILFLLYIKPSKKIEYITNSGGQT